MKIGVTTLELPTLEQALQRGVEGPEIKVGDEVFYRLAAMTRINIPRIYQEGLNTDTRYKDGFCVIEGSDCVSKRIFDQMVEDRVLKMRVIQTSDLRREILSR